VSRALVFDGRVKKGRFIPDDSERYSMNYYWGVLIAECVAWSGADPDDFHDEFKEKVLRPMLERRIHVGLPNGMHLGGQPTTTTLSMKEMTTYISRCKDYAFHEWGVEVPDIDHVSMR
jgi:hypothetical protein